MRPVYLAAVRVHATPESGKGTTSVVEDYLQVLHYLTRDGFVVIAARLAERLNVTPPTVTATLQRMERDGLIQHGPRKEILLTPEGLLPAERMKHELHDEPADG